MFNSVLISFHLLWLLSRSPVVHALPGPLYYFISPQCQQSGTFTSAHADEALGFTKAAIRKDNENFEAVLEGRPPADPNQANIFKWIYSMTTQDTAFARTMDDREQILRYEETSIRSISTLRIECDNDRSTSETPRGRWERVQDIPPSPDQDPNAPMQNSQRNQAALLPGSVVEYTDVDNRMRENAASKWCYNTRTTDAIWHTTPERDNQGQNEDRVVFTICDKVANTPPWAWSLDAFLASNRKDRILSVGNIDRFAGFGSVLFLYMLYQLPPLQKQMTVRQLATTADLNRLENIFYLNSWESQRSAGAYAWYDLLAGFADRGYVFKTSAAFGINNVTTSPGWTPNELVPALKGPLVYDPGYVFPRDG